MQTPEIKSHVANTVPHCKGQEQWRPHFLFLLETESICVRALQLTFPEALSLKTRMGRLHFLSVLRISNNGAGLTQRPSLALLDLLMETTQTQGWLHPNLKAHVCEFHATYMSLVLFLSTSFCSRGSIYVSQSMYPEKGIWEGCVDLRLLLTASPAKLHNKSCPLSPTGPANRRRQLPGEGVSVLQTQRADISN